MKQSLFITFCLERKVSGEKHKSLWLYQLFRKTIVNNISFPETVGVINVIVKFPIEISKFPPNSI